MLSTTDINVVSVVVGPHERGRSNDSTLTGILDCSDPSWLRKRLLLVIFNQLKQPRPYQRPNTSLYAPKAGVANQCKVAKPLLGLAVLVSVDLKCI